MYKREQTSIRMFSAYHGHLTSLVDLSSYKFRKLTKPAKMPEHVHVVSKNKIIDITNRIYRTIKSYP